MKTKRVVAAVIKSENEKGEPIVFATQRGYGEYKDGAVYGDVDGIYCETKIFGTEDFGYENYKLFKAHLKEIGLDAVFTEGPGVHEWRVWERDIQKAIEFFGLTGDEVKGNAF